MPSNSSKVAAITPRQQPHATKGLWVAAELRQSILLGELPPGTRLPEQELARRFGCSATPVREAIRLLIAEGLVTHEPHHPPEVTDLELDDPAEVYLVQAQLQRLAILLSASELTPERIARADAINREMKALIARGDLKPLKTLNYQFHFALFESRRLAWLTRIIAGLWTRYPLDTLWSIPKRAELSVAEHDTILEALRAGDIRRAGQLVVDHHVSSARSALGDAAFSDPIREELSK